MEHDAGRSEKMNRRQEPAIAAMLSNPTIEAAAKVAGVGEATLLRWLRTPSFNQAYAEARRRVLDGAIVELQASTAAAVTKLRELMDCGSRPIELRAALSIIEYGVRAKESYDSLERVSAPAAQAAKREEYSGASDRVPGVRLSVGYTPCSPQSGADAAPPKVYRFEDHPDEYERMPNGSWRFVSKRRKSSEGASCPQSVETPGGKAVDCEGSGPGFEMESSDPSARQESDGPRSVDASGGDAAEFGDSGTSSMVSVAEAVEPIPKPSIALSVARLKGDPRTVVRSLRRPDASPFCGQAGIPVAGGWR